MVFIVSDEKLAITHIIVTLYVLCHFYIACFQDFLSTFDFNLIDQVFGIMFFNLVNTFFISKMPIWIFL